MTAAQKIPEFELPAVFLDAIKQYVGSRNVKDLTPNQRADLATVAYQAAKDVGRVLNGQPLAQLSIEEWTAAKPAPLVEPEQYRCASAKCPGYSWPASERAHPADTCGE